VINPAFDLHDLVAPATDEVSGLLNILQQWNWRPRRRTATLPARPCGWFPPTSATTSGKPGANASWQVTVTTPARRQQTVQASAAFRADSVIKNASVTLNATSSHFNQLGGGRAQHSHLCDSLVPSGRRCSTPRSPGTHRGGGGGPQPAGPAYLVDPSVRWRRTPSPASGGTAVPGFCPAAGPGREIFSNTSNGRHDRHGCSFGASFVATSSLARCRPSRLRLAPGCRGTVSVGGGCLPGRATPPGGDVPTPCGAAVWRARERPVTLPAWSRRDCFPGTFPRRADRWQRARPVRVPVATNSFTVPSNLPFILRYLEGKRGVLGNDPENQVSAYLVAPGGQTMGYGFELPHHLGSPRPGAGRVPRAFSCSPVHVHPSPRVDADHRLHLAGAGNELADPSPGWSSFNVRSVERGKLPAGPRTKLTDGQS